MLEPASRTRISCDYQLLNLEISLSLSASLISLLERNNLHQCQPVPEKTLHLHLKHDLIVRYHCPSDLSVSPLFSCFKALRTLHSVYRADEYQTTGDVHRVATVVPDR